VYEKICTYELTENALLHNKDEKELGTRSVTDQLLRSREHYKRYVSVKDKSLL
jgi:hypothetical protein